MALSTTPIAPNRKLVGASVESTKGTLNSPASVLSGTLVYDATFSPQAIFQNGVRQPNMDASGEFPPQAGVKQVQITFRTEVIHNDATGTLLSACGFKSDGAATPTYKPSVDRSDHKTLSIAIWEGGRKKEARGCSGTFTIDASNTAAKIFINWTFTGILDDVTDAAMPSGPTLPGTPPFQVENMTFTLGGSNIPAIAGYQIDANTGVGMREDATAAGGVIYAVASPGTPTMQIEPEATTVANHDVYGDLLSATEQALVADVNDSTASGANTFSINAPKFQRTDVQDSARQDVLTDAVTAGLYRDTGDDQLKIQIW